MHHFFLSLFNRVSQKHCYCQGTSSFPSPPLLLFQAANGAYSTAGRIVFVFIWKENKDYCWWGKAAASRIKLLFLPYVFALRVEAQFNLLFPAVSTNTRRFIYTLPLICSIQFSINSFQQNPCVKQKCLSKATEKYYLPYIFSASLYFHSKLPNLIFIYNT